MSANRPHVVYLVLLIVTAVSAVGALFVGSVDLSDDSLRQILLGLRGVRATAAFVVGAALAVAGVLVQGLFRNPLASPSIIGTTSGAALGGRLAILAHGLTVGVGKAAKISPDALLPIGCFAGALLSLLALLLIARKRDDLVVLLLTGFLLSSLFISVGGLVLSIAQDRWGLARAMVVFALGDVSGATPAQIWLALPLLLFGTVAAWLWGRPLDLMLSGEEEAATLGIDVVQLRRWVIIWTAMLTGAAVAIGGSIGFVGLVVPHALRPWVGAAHRWLTPAAFLLGGSFVMVCDLLARSVPGQGEVPLGAVTGLVGAPLFLWMLLRSRRSLHV
ncbi:MAG: iron ABC transporter permease [Deltaproteobacteria bacterium]|nr:iron ABC transporter permease [Deltaproteobacteria bacterium]